MSRQLMKEQFDKKAKRHPFSIADKVMLWKPYKSGGLSKCFQPNWNGPWSIVKFTGRRKVNCKISNCVDPTIHLNVHVNQLKKHKGTVDSYLETVPKRVSFRTNVADEVVHVDNSQLSDVFLDYLEDYDADENLSLIHI